MIALNIFSFEISVLKFKALSNNFLTLEKNFENQMRHDLRKIQSIFDCTPEIILTLNRMRVNRPATLLKKKLWHRCFPLNFAKFLRTPLSIEHLRWLLLTKQMISKPDDFCSIFKILFLYIKNYSVLKLLAGLGKCDFVVIWLLSY